MSERRILGLVANAIVRAVVNRIDPDGSFAQVLGLSGRAKPDIEVFQPQGVHFKPPVGSDGILAAASGDAGCSVLLSAHDRSKLPADVIAEGEGGLHYLGAYKVFLNADGTLSLGTKVPTDFVALASKVDAVFTLIDSTISGWTPVAGDGGAALKAAWTAAFPAGPAPVGSLVVKAQ